MTTIIITNCTSRKRLAGLEPIVLKDGDFSSVEAMAKSWKNQLNKQKLSLPVASLYVGRSVSDAKFVAAKLNARLMFVSTGLGLIENDSKHPPYNLTINKTLHSIKPHLKNLNAQPSDWWREINAAQSKSNALSSLINQPSISLVMIALSSSYIELISKELENIDREAIGKLRIFTSRPGIKALTGNLQKTVMPYDERLEASTLPGTRNDFPQRSMRHFIDMLDLSGASIDTAKIAVREAMNQLHIAEQVTRSRLPDPEISLLIESAWYMHNGSSARLLRYLRDEALVSCEQSRFQRIWKSIHSKKSSQE